jgi:prolyl oligopeptidase
VVIVSDDLGRSAAAVPFAVVTAADRSDLARFGLRRVDAVDVYGDVAFPDPFRQLEDETRAVQAWQAQRHADAGAALDAIAGMTELRAELAVHLAADRFAPPIAASGRWLWGRQDASGQVRALRVGDAPDDPRRSRPLIAASDVPLDGDEAIEWVAPAPDGRLAAVAVTSHGDEQHALALVHIGSGELVGPPVRHVGDAAWLPDGSGLYLTRTAGPSTELPLRRLAFLAPGARAEDVPSPARVADALLSVAVSGDGRWVAALAASHAQLVGVWDRRAERWAFVLPEGERRTFAGFFLGGEYVAVTDEGAPRGRLVAAPLDALGDAARWRELVAQDEAVLRSAAPLARDMLLYELLDGTPRLRIVSREGEPRGVIAPPPGFTIGPSGGFRMGEPTLFPAQVANGRVLFTASAPGRSPTLWRHDLAGGRLDELTRPAVELPPLAVERRGCTAPNGTPVAYELIRRADSGEGPVPVLLHAYGGFDGAALPRGYLGPFAPWVAAGGAYVFAHVRGDGTFGTDRWHDGRRERKQHSFDDLFACAEELIASGLTTPAQLALAGASNGGLLACAGLVQRPELFKAVAALVPMTDMARLGRERFPEGFLDEYGDVRDPAQAAVLRALSPYHGVRAGAPTPATILVAGTRDMRTHALHARKLAAALLETAAPETPVLLRVHADSGHETAVDGPPARSAEWLGFLMSQVGLPLAGRDGGWAVAQADVSPAAPAAPARSPAA